ncbi:MAG: uncharacterized protein JWN69_1679 [Alphaproteobacteria bacterium]|nr:uncharacterized protein [Alphaproteobacteria bacterium]
MVTKADIWPELTWAGWRDTAITLQLWMQIVGKVRLSLTPWLNHSWHVPHYVSARGLTTSAIFHLDEAFELEFDLLEHRLLFRDSGGSEDGLALRPQSVADFHSGLFALLSRNGIEVAIHEFPNEVADPIRFADDRTHCSYDPDAARRFWRVLLTANRLLGQFRTAFVGKASPVHFFWGSFDLAVTRFSGRPAPPHPGGVPNLPDAIAREAYSHEVSSAGFWPGSDAFPHAAFYSYAYPAPEGFANAPIMPAAARFEPMLGEFVFRYEDLRTSPNPAQALMTFLTSTYEAAAELGHWDPTLDCAPGLPRRPRPV